MDIMKNKHSCMDYMPWNWSKQVIKRMLGEDTAVHSHSEDGVFSDTISG